MSDKEVKDIDQDPSEGMLTAADMDAMDQEARDHEPVARSGFAKRRKKSRRRIPVPADEIDAIPQEEVKPATVVAKEEKPEPVAEAKEEPVKEEPKAEAADSKVVADKPTSKEEKPTEEVAAKSEEIAGIKIDDSIAIPNLETIDLSGYEGFNHLQVASGEAEKGNAPEKVAAPAPEAKAEEKPVVLDEPKAEVVEKVVTDEKIDNPDEDRLVAVAMNIQVKPTSKKARASTKAKRTDLANRVRKCLKTTYMLGEARKRMTVPSAAVAKKVGVGTFAALMLLNLDYNQIQSNVSTIAGIPASAGQSMASALENVTNWNVATIDAVRNNVLNMVANSLSGAADTVQSYADNDTSDSNRNIDVAIEAITGSVQHGDSVANLENADNPPEVRPTPKVHKP